MPTTVLTMSGLTQMEKVVGNSRVEKGNRLIVVHTGLMYVWAAALVFCCNTKSADYHDEMSLALNYIWSGGAIIYYRMFLLPLQLFRTMHNKQRNKPPCKSAKKAEMKKCLESKGVT